MPCSAPASAYGRTVLSLPTSLRVFPPSPSMAQDDRASCAIAAAPRQRSVGRQAAAAIMRLLTKTQCPKLVPLCPRMALAHRDEMTHVIGEHESDLQKVAQGSRGRSPTGQHDL